MINNWMIPRCKRDINVDILSDILKVFSDAGAINNEWRSNKKLQKEVAKLLYERKIIIPKESNSPKLSGARTYMAQLKCLELIRFDDKNLIQFTDAGKTIKNEKSLGVLRKLLFDFQYPSFYSKSKGVKIAAKFQIRPFLFILKFLLDKEIKFLTEPELFHFIIPFAENKELYNKIKKDLLDYRNNPKKFRADKHLKKFKRSNKKHPKKKRNNVKYLKDIANTFMNYLSAAKLISYKEKDKSLVENRNDSRIEIEEKVKNLARNYIEKEKPLKSDC